MRAHSTCRWADEIKDVTHTPGSFCPSFALALGEGEPVCPQVVLPLLRGPRGPDADVRVVERDLVAALRERAAQSQGRRLR